MSDVAGIILHHILKNPIDSIELWSKLKLQYFDSAYSEIYISIAKYYDKFGSIPNFETLEITIRDSNLRKKIKSLNLLDVPDNIDIDVAIETLIDQFTQDEILNELYKYLEKITHYSSEESLSKLSNIILDISEKTQKHDSIFLMNEAFIMDPEDLKSRVPLTLNNTFDAFTGGLSLTELVMLGGYRGSGKTIAACNIAANHYRNGDSVLFFSIEMRAKEINRRLMSILSGVNNRNIKNQNCSKEELIEIAKVRSNFFLDSNDLVEEFIKNNDYLNFEKQLAKRQLKQDNQIVIVDNRSLTLSDIDLNLQTFKLKFGDKLKVAVVDYVNQIVTPDKYDWKSQIELSKALKDLAAKHEILLVTPYQTDSTGEARFAKGLLDAADIAISLSNKDKYIECNSTKVRNEAKFTFNIPMDWNSLRMSQEDYIIEDNETEKSDENARDI